MFIIDISLLSDSLLTFFLAFLIDLAFGEVPDRIHPTLWMGKVTDYFKPKLKNENPRVEKIFGIQQSFWVQRGNRHASAIPLWLHIRRLITVLC
jgi:cobalamin biosynthesis protein CobD/CbiB